MYKSGPVVNISGYKFVELDDLENLRADLLAICTSQNLKGTILLSDEGINCFLAGGRQAIDAFLKHLKSLPPFADFEAKESFNDYQPFSRMLIKIKKEIITFDMPEIKPASRRASKIAPEELKRWLDNDQEVVLLDTRNDYEIELGTFENATTVNIDNFREFPDAIKALPVDYRKKPIVMFCTGGIRCEKAGPYMEDAGFEDVWQLDGGILKYFELCGGAHWKGECFVFDKRVALNPELSETETTLCYVCQAVLNERDQLQPTYKFGVSCPQCFTEEQEEGPTVLDVSERLEKIVAATKPMPGSIPYENFRPMTVSREMDGLSLIGFLNALKTHLSEEEWIQIVERGEVLHKGKPVGLDRMVMHGQKYYHLLPNTTEPDVNLDIDLLFEDEDFVVINKPAPIPMHPCGRFNKNSLQHILYEVYAPDRIRLVHRLDANTSGVVVYARTKKLATLLIEQFGQGRVSKEYVAGVHGLTPGNFFSEKKIASGPGEGGVRFLDEQGQQARTDFETIVKDETANQSMVIARPKTGRTNQIRLHLWDSGFPIIGDPTYLPDQRVGGNQTNAVDDPPMQLHARRIEFIHPISKIKMEFSAPDPEWFRT